MLFRSILSGLPFADIPVIYQMSSLFIYPSYFEGFGIPIIEALNSGVPVIGATGSCLEEAGGPNSIYVDPDNESQLAAEINKVLNDKVLQEQMIEQGKEYVKRFMPEVISSQMMKVYESVTGIRK